MTLWFAQIAIALFQFSLATQPPAFLVRSSCRKTLTLSVHVGSANTDAISPSELHVFAKTNKRPLHDPTELSLAYPAHYTAHREN
jgi:hypothetical protein